MNHTRGSLKRPSSAVRAHVPGYNPTPRGKADKQPFTRLSDDGEIHSPSSKGSDEEFDVPATKRHIGDATGALCLSRFNPNLKQLPGSSGACLDQADHPTGSRSKSDTIQRIHERAR